MSDFVRRRTGVIVSEKKAFLTFYIARLKPQSVLNAGERCPGSKKIQMAVI